MSEKKKKKIDTCGFSEALTRFLREREREKTNPVYGFKFRVCVGRRNCVLLVNSLCVYYCRSYNSWRGRIYVIYTQHYYSNGEFE